MALTDVTSVVSALIAGSGLAATAWQLLGLRRDRRAARVSELRSVALDTRVLVLPTHADAGDGQSLWRYSFRVTNPGRLPVTRVRTEITFPFPVARRHHDGSLEPARPTLEIYIPVVPSRSEAVRERSVLVPWQQRDRLRETRAVITFQAPDAGPVRTVWPDEPVLRPDRRLRRLIADPPR